LAIAKDENLMAQLKTDKKLTGTMLQDKYGVTTEMTPEFIENFYKLSRMEYDIGDYKTAANCLTVYRAISNNTEKNFSALWGHFASSILTQNWEESLKDLKELQSIIDSKNSTPALKQLQQRTWLIHWSLFVYFNHNRSLFADSFFNDKYINVIQTTCPHILRYMTVAIITSKKKKNLMPDLVKIIQQESYTYRDAVTEFMECLFVNFDFEGAQTKLRECEATLLNDFFLVGIKDEFIENARLFIFETYCRIHQYIDIGLIAQKLNMGTDAAEKWIVNLIRNAKLDAKIDSENNTVIMGNQSPIVYQQVIERTKELSAKITTKSYKDVNKHHANEEIEE